MSLRSSVTALVIGNCILFFYETANADDYWSRQAQRTADQMYMQSTNRFIQGQQQQLIDNYKTWSPPDYVPYKWKNPYETQVPKNQYSPPPTLPNSYGTYKYGSTTGKFSSSRYLPSSFSGEERTSYSYGSATKTTGVTVAQIVSGSLLGIGIGVCVVSLYPMLDGKSDVALPMILVGGGVTALGLAFRVL